MTTTEQTTDTTYNGWTNRETWLVNLWLTYDMVEGLFAGITDLHLYTDTPYAMTRERRFVAADALRNLVEELVGDTLDEATMLTDLLMTSLSHVNYQEIADHYCDEFPYRGLREEG